MSADRSNAGPPRTARPDDTARPDETVHVIGSDTTDERFGQQLALVSRATAELALLGPEDDLYAFVARRLCELQPDAVVVVSEWLEGDAETQEMVRIEAVDGLGALLPKILKALGRDLVGMTMPPSASRIRLRNDFMPQRTSDSIDVLTSGRLPATVGRALVSLVGIKAVYALDLGWEGRTYANIAWVLRESTELIAPSLISLFVRQVSAVLHRRRIEQTAKQALAASEAKYRLLADAATDVIWTMDPRLRFTYVSPSIERLLGQPPEAVQGHRLDEFLSASSITRALETFVEAQAAKAPGRIWTLELDVLHVDGFYVPTETNAKLLYDERGELTGLLGVSRDITLRKSAEERFRLAAELGSDLIYEWEVQSDRLEWFGGVDEALGYEQGWLPRTIEAWAQRIHPEDQQLLADAVERHRVDTEPIHYEYRVRHRDGSWRTWKDHGTPVLGDDGRPRKWIGVCTDITEQRRAANEQQRLEEQFRQAQKLESLGVLAGGIAHDFNNLLLGVLGNAEMALMDLPADAPARESIDAIADAARRAAELSRQMLAYSGKGHFVIERLDLQALVRDMSSLLESTVSKAAVLRYDFGPDVPLIEGDAAQLRQVVVNLITNAADALGDRSGVISIATGVRDCDRAYLASTYLAEDLPEGRYSTLVVSDDGEGMSAEIQARVFDPFFSTRFTGRGLGLAAVLGIVRGHRGAIRLDSELGQGTTFTVLLPTARQAIATSSEPPRSDRKWRGSGVVLLADDEHTVRRVTSRLLTRLGFEVRAVDNGRQAVDLFREQRAEIVCVLLDLTMPEMDGEQCFRELRAIDPDVPVLLTSGYDEQELQSRFAGEGFAGFIQKPFSFARLRSQLRLVLEPIGG